MTKLSTQLPATLSTNRSRRLQITIISLLSAAVAVGAIAYSNYLDWSREQLNRLSSGSQVIDTAAGRIEYSLQDGDEPVLLFVHGSGGGYDSAPDSWPGFRILVPSRPGHLRTPIEVGRTPQQQARSFAALLDTLHLEGPVVVMATSGGGPAGISFAANYPDRTAAFVALSAVSQSLQDLPAMPGFLNGDFMNWIVLSSAQHLVDDPAVALTLNLWPPSLRAEGRDNDLKQFADLAPPADRISAPTLIVHGAADRTVPFMQSELLLDQISGAQLHRVDGGDHMIMFTHREEVRGAVNLFLMNLDLTDWTDR